MYGQRYASAHRHYGQRYASTYRHGMPVHITADGRSNLTRQGIFGPFYITYYFYIAFYSGQSCDQNRGLLYKVPRYLLDSSKAY